MLTETERKACKKPYLSVRLVAKILGIRPNTAMAWCESHDLYVMVNGKRKIARSRIREAFPEAFRELMEEMYDPGNDDFSK